MRSHVDVSPGNSRLHLAVALLLIPLWVLAPLSAWAQNRAVTIAIVSGNNQALVPLKPSAALVVQVVDDQGAPVADAAVAWQANGATASLAASSTRTDSNGQSQNTLTTVLPGTYTVTAAVNCDCSQSSPSVTFSFTNGVANLPALTPPQVAVANAIDRACPALATSSNTLTAPQQDFLARCSEVVVGASSAAVPSALDAMLNNKAQPQNQLASGVQSSQLNNLNARFAELRQGAHGLSLGGVGFIDNGRVVSLAMLGDAFRKDAAQGSDEVGKDFDRWGFFATGMIDSGGFDATAVAPGFDFHNASLTAGVDYRFNAEFVGGLALGYNHNASDLDRNVGNLDVDGYGVSAYFSWYHANDWYIEGSLGLGRLDYDLKRNIIYDIAALGSGGGTTHVDQVARSSPDGDQSTFSLTAGHDFNRDAWSFSPYLRGIWSHLSLDAFDETIADSSAPGFGLATHVNSRSLSSQLGVLGGRLSYTINENWGVLVPNAVVEWNHEFKNDPQTVVTRFLADPTQTPIIVTDPRIDQDYFNLGIGLNAILPKGRSGFLYFEHVTGYSGVHENRLSAGVRIEF